MSPARAFAGVRMDEVGIASLPFLVVARRFAKDETAPHILMQGQAMEFLNGSVPAPHAGRHAFDAFAHFSPWLPCVLIASFGPLWIGHAIALVGWVEFIRPPGIALPRRPGSSQ